MNSFCISARLEYECSSILSGPRALTPSCSSRAEAVRSARCSLLVLSLVVFCIFLGSVVFNLVRVILLHWLLCVADLFARSDAAAAAARTRWRVDSDTRAD